MKWVSCDDPNEVGYLFWHAKSQTHYFTNQYNKRFSYTLNNFKFSNNCLWRCIYCKSKEHNKPTLKLFDVLLYDGEWLISKLPDKLCSEYTFEHRNEMARIMLNNAQCLAFNPNDDITLNFAELHDHIETAITKSCESGLKKAALVFDLSNISDMNNDMALDQMMWLDNEENEDKRRMRLERSKAVGSIFYGSFVEDSELHVPSTYHPVKIASNLSQDLIEDGDIFLCRYDWPTQVYEAVQALSR